MGGMRASISVVVQPFKLDDFQPFDKAELVVCDHDDLTLKVERTLNRAQIVLSHQWLPPIKIGNDALRFRVSR
jgi:hypothetical protein